MEQISTSTSSKTGLAQTKTFKKISSLCMKEWKALKFKHKNLNASKILTKYGAITTLTKPLTSKLSLSSATQKKDYAKRKKKSTSGLSSNIWSSSTTSKTFCILLTTQIHDWYKILSSRTILSIQMCDRTGPWWFKEQKWPRMTIHTAWGCTGPQSIPLKLGHLRFVFYPMLGSSFISTLPWLLSMRHPS